MLRKNKKTEEEKELNDIPKLTVAHYEEITKLVTRLGGVHQVLAYWGAVSLDEKGFISGIKYYPSEKQNEFTTSKYEKFEPLKGIFYTGRGFFTAIPYNWCTEWIRQWEWYVSQNRHREDIKPLFVKNKSLSEIRKSFAIK